MLGRVWVVEYVVEGKNEDGMVRTRGRGRLW